MSGVMVYLEKTKENNIEPIGLELLGIGKKLANDSDTELSAVLIGSNVSQVAEEAAYFGVDKLYKIEHRLFEYFKPDVWVDALEKLCKKINPKILLMGHTTIGMDVAPRLAVKLNTRLTTDCIGLAIQENGLLLRTKQIYGGNIIATFKVEGQPQFATIRVKVFGLAKRSSTKAEIVEIDLDVDESVIKAEFVEEVTEEIIDLDKAKAIICGGRGVGGADGFILLKEVAHVLGRFFEGAEIAATKPPVDVGYIPSFRQIGLTGIKVSPDLYIGIGISGASQHLVGMLGSKKIVAINTDPKANIFNVADYGVVGDYKEVLPSFKKKLEELF
jgi:electron transfer flavoprotein alpha subunit